MDQVNNQAEQMADLTFELVKTWRDNELFLAEKFNLTPVEFKFLRFFRNSNSLNVKELVKLMNLTPGRITHIITSLESKGLITREIDPDDRRGIIVLLTESSLPLIKNLNENHIRLHSEILSHMEAERIPSVISAMEELVKGFKNWSEVK
ncbi:MAG: MarR family transcriptional regulator [Bacteroidota bacterium]|nr:MarR family transcriptional regulator [Bacteroidota bacterium]MDP4190076.1 MarR family transcriptional regulator [Bacteroidota bacterium]MDP4193691.1 MarR family transcriptional regulator [Bacteroidota bacterium]